MFTLPYYYASSVVITSEALFELSDRSEVPLELPKHMSLLISVTFSTIKKKGGFLSKFSD